MSRPTSVTSSVKARVGAVFAALAAAALFIAFGGLDWVTGDGNVERLLTETGVVGPIVFVLVMWVTQPFGVPGVFYMVPAGIVWPTPLAIALSWVGNMGSSYIGFSFARWVARDWVKARIPARMHAFDDRLNDGGLPPVILLRLVFGQLPPADWLLGVTKVRTPNLLLGTAIGILPGVVVAVVAGGGLVSWLADMPPSARMLAVAVLATVALGVLLLKRRRSEYVRVTLAKQDE